MQVNLLKCGSKPITSVINVVLSDYRFLLFLLLNSLNLSRFLKIKKGTLKKKKKPYECTYCIHDQ